MPSNILKSSYICVTEVHTRVCVCVCVCYLRTGSDAGVSLIRLGPPQFPLLTAKKRNKTLILLKLINDINFKRILAKFQTDDLNWLVEGMRPQHNEALWSFLACHHRMSLWSTISSKSPLLKAIPASGQGIAGSCRGL